MNETLQEVLLLQRLYTAYIYIYISQGRELAKQYVEEGTEWNREVRSEKIERFATC